MLFSYQKAGQEELPRHTKAFVRAANKMNVSHGVVISPQAFTSFLHESVYGVEELLEAASDESSERVNNEMHRRIVTGRVHAEVAEVLSEAYDILCLDETVQEQREYKLVAVLSCDHPVSQSSVIINIGTRKALIDAVRMLWSRGFRYPFTNTQLAILLYRMPALKATARATFENDVIRVEAGIGWGCFVDVIEVRDVYLVSQGMLVDKIIRTQDSAVYRNPRTQEIVQSKPLEASSQKITDRTAVDIASAFSRLQVESGVFGVSDSGIVLLNVIGSAEAITTSSEEIIPIDQTNPSPDAQIPVKPAENIEEPVEISIIDIEEENTSEPFLEEEIIVAQPEELTVDDPFSDNEQNTSEESKQAIDKKAQEILLLAHKTILLRLEEWFDASNPPGFEELVRLISSRRQIPYKNRILTLHEMKEQGAFESPSPEAVRFGLETVDRFMREF